METVQHDGEASVEGRTQERGRALLATLRREQTHAGTQEWLYAWVMRLTTRDEALKTELFRFVDVLPTLAHPDAIWTHLLEYLRQPGVTLPPGLNGLLTRIDQFAPARWAAGVAARTGTRAMARRFIAGRNAREAVRAVLRIRAQGLAFTLDLLGEAVASDAEALAYQERYLDVIRDLSGMAGTWPDDLRTDASPFGPLPKVNVSLKLSSLTAHFDPMAAAATSEAVKDRLRPILSLARRHGVFVHVDMEQHDVCGLTQRIFQEVLLEDQYRDWPDVGIVVQAYLRRSADDLCALREWAERRGTPVWVRLVKGAYWDYETIHATQQNYPVPVFGHKDETDRSFERLTGFLLDHWQTLRPAIATHNVRSAAHAQALAERKGLPRRAVEFQVLYGIGEPPGRALAAQGERVRVYVPFGELLPGMAYLVRRLLENTSNDSFVRTVAEHPESEAALLADPALVTHSPVPALGGAYPGSFNEPETDFAVPAYPTKMRQALDEVRGRLGMTVPIVIDGRRETSPETVERPDPSEARRVASRVCYATPEQAERALAAAHAAFPGWHDTPVAARTALLRGVAAEFRRRRFEISAWQVFEVGKPWREADGDVAEAIDYCEFYAREMERLAAPRRRDVAGEWNDYSYDARGPAAIIAPWNFPLAILTGMTVAALVTGNPVVMKPSEQSSRVGYFLMEALLAAGVPPGVAHFLPGRGEIIGAQLVADPRIALIAFTGSKDVGLSILRDAAPVRDGQREIKRVIAELGGKNAILVDEDADLDEAVRGVLVSAMGYAGQKCSACSRVIVIGSVRTPFKRRLAEAIRSVPIGPAEEPATLLGPVVDRDAQERIGRYLEIGRQEGRLLAEAPVPPDLKARGFYVPAAAFTACPPDGRLCRDEIFGPVLAVLEARDLDEALALALDSPYALAGGFYSRSPEHIARVRREFRVGNLYINRKITGALVDRQPFGGAAMSGVGSKAGGPDYLLQFLVPRTVTESVMRRGFAPRRGETP